MVEDHVSILTIGHSTHSLDEFVDLLRQHNVSAVADVRSAPYSGYCPHFNKDPLLKSLLENGIKYVFLGRELGARSDDPSCYDNGVVQYSRLAKTQAFQEGLVRLKKGASEHNIALMCSEREPLDCHRTLLIARVLEEQNIEVTHILSDGRLENNNDTMERLIGVVGLPQNDLFRTKEELMTDAANRQEERIAYKDEKMMAENTGKPI